MMSSWSDCPSASIGYCIQLYKGDGRSYIVCVILGIGMNCGHFNLGEKEEGRKLLLFIATAPEYGASVKDHWCKVSDTYGI